MDKDNIEIPANRIIDEPNGQLVLAKEEIINIKFTTFQVRMIEKVVIKHVSS